MTRTSITRYFLTCFYFTLSGCIPIHYQNYDPPTSTWIISSKLAQNGCIDISGIYNNIGKPASLNRDWDESSNSLANLIGKRSKKYKEQSQSPSRINLHYSDSGDIIYTEIDSHSTTISTPIVFVKEVDFSCTPSEITFKAVGVKTGQMADFYLERTYIRISKLTDAHLMVTKQKISDGAWIILMGHDSEINKFKFEEIFPTH